jgi:hypothetical protein
MAGLLTGARLVRGACAGLLAFASAAIATAQSAAIHVDVGDLKLEGLPPQELANGHCSLFLWSRSSRPVFILFAQDNPAQASVQVNGRIKVAARKSTSGKQIYGQFENQHFAGNGVAFDLQLAFDEDRPIKDGVVISSGVLRTKLSDGAEAVQPVGGMIGCKPA